MEEEPQKNQQKLSLKKILTSSETKMLTKLHNELKCAHTNSYHN